MTRFLLTILLIGYILIGTVVYGQTSVAIPSAIVDKATKNLKDKLASSVAELVKNNKAVSGVVTAVTGGSFKILTDDNKEYEIKLDDVLTKYFQLIGGQKKEIKKEDVKKGTYIIVTGVINDRVIDANFVYIDEQFLVESGKITEVNKDNFSLKVITASKDNYTLDIETFTKQQILNIKTLEVERVGFSKIKEGDTIHFVVKNTGQEKDNRYSAQKILIIPQEFFLK